MTDKWERLEAALSKDDDGVATHAALDEIMRDASAEDLRRLLAITRDHPLESAQEILGVLGEHASQLSDTDKGQLRDLLRVALRSRDPSTRSTAADGLAGLGTSADWEQISHLIDDDEPLVRISALDALVALDSAKAQPVIRKREHLEMDGLVRANVLAHTYLSNDDATLPDFMLSREPDDEWERPCLFLGTVMEAVTEKTDITRLIPLERTCHRLLDEDPPPIAEEAIRRFLDAFQRWH